MSQEAQEQDIVRTDTGTRDTGVDVGPLCESVAEDTSVTSDKVVSEACIERTASGEPL